MKYLISSLLILFSLQSLAISPVANLVFEGQLLDSNGDPIIGSNIPFKIQVLDGSCIVFEETINRNLLNGDKGFFSLNIGSYAKTSGSESLVDALDYSKTTLTCLTSDVSKAPSAPRNLKIIVDGEAFGIIPIQSAAYAIHAEKLGGKSASEFVQLSLTGYVPMDKIGTGNPGSGKYLDGSGAWTTFPTAVTGVTGTGPISVTTGTTPVVTIATASSSTSGALSSTDWNTFNDKLGSLTTFSGDMSGGVSSTSVDKIKGKAVEYTSIAGGQFLKYDSTGDGKWINSGISFSELISKPTTLSGYGISDAASSSSLSNYLLLAGGTLTGDLTLNGQKEFRFADADSSHYVGLKSPSSVASNKVWTLPASDGTNGQFLKTDGNGVLSWVSGNSGTVTGVTGIGPISVTTNGSTPEVSITAASGTTSGALSSTDWTKFDSKLGTDLATGKIWVGNNDGTPTATAVGVTGDISLSFESSTTSGKMIINKIKGIDVSSTPPTLSGQVMRYNSTGAGKWEPGFVAIGDLRSPATGTPALPTACTSGQTLTWSAVSDALSCSDIVVSESNFATTEPNKFLAGPSLSGAANAKPTLRKIVAADLPTVFSPPAGTAADPSYVFSSDLNTGIFGAAADVLGFSTNSSERMRITSDGKVGIGSTAPSESLSVNGNLIVGKAPLTLAKLNEVSMTSTSTTITVTSTAGYPNSGTLLIDNEAMTYTGLTGTTFTGLTRGALGSTAVAHAKDAIINNYLSSVVSNSTTPKMVITGSGNIGIGTASPSNAVSVERDYNGKVGISVRNSRSAVDYQIPSTEWVNNSIAEIKVENDSNDTASIQIGSSKFSNINGRGNALFAASKGMTFLSNNDSEFTSGTNKKNINFIAGGYNNIPALVVEATDSSSGNPSIGKIKIITGGTASDPTGYYLPTASPTTSGHVLAVDVVGTGSTSTTTKWVAPTAGSGGDISACPANMTHIPGDLANGKRAYCIDTTGTAANMTASQAAWSCASTNDRKICPISLIKRAGKISGTVNLDAAEGSFPFISGSLGTTGSWAQSATYTFFCCLD